MVWLIQKPRQRYKKKRIYANFYVIFFTYFKKMLKYLRMSKKSSTFAVAKVVDKWVVDE